VPIKKAFNLIIQAKGSFLLSWRFCRCRRWWWFTHIVWRRTTGAYCADYRSQQYNAHYFLFHSSRMF